MEVDADNCVYRPASLWEGALSSVDESGRKEVSYDQNRYYLRLSGSREDHID